MQFLWSKKSLWYTEKNETIFILISLKRYLSHPEKSILNYQVFLNFKEAL